MSRPDGQNFRLFSPVTKLSKLFLFSLLILFSQSEHANAGIDFPSNLELGAVCDVDVANDRQSVYSSPSYIPSHGRCSIHMECNIEYNDNDDEDIEDTSILGSIARCSCSDQRVVCASDSKTYRNKCLLPSSVIVRRYQPCDSGPNITIPEEFVLEFSEGQDLVLGCKLTGYPWPTVTWTFMNPEKLSVNAESIGGITSTKRIPEDDKLITVESWLMIPKVLKWHEGNYTCTATNRLGSDSLTSQVIIYQRTL